VSRPTTGFPSSRGCGLLARGQTVGPGCVVLDFSTHMDEIQEVRPDDRRAVVQPGVVQDRLDDRLAEDGLKFAPDPASSARATVVGGIGNNSTGAHSVRYGITDAYTEELTVVLADGSLIETREVVLDSPEYEEIVAKDDREAALYETVRELVEENEAEIDEKYPNLKRSVSGYNLHKVIYENDDGEDVINLSKLFVGAEGRSARSSRPRCRSSPGPRTALALYTFDSLVNAMKAVPEALEFPVSAVELMDDEVFALAAGSQEFAQYAEPIPDRATAALMLEWDSELVDDFEAAIADTNAHFVEEGDAFDVLEAYTDEDQEDPLEAPEGSDSPLDEHAGRPETVPVHRGRDGAARGARGVRRAVRGRTHRPRHLGGVLRTRRERHPPHPPHPLAEGGGGRREDALHLRGRHRPSSWNTTAPSRASTATARAHRVQPEDVRRGALERVPELKSTFDPEWRMNPGKVVYVDGDTAAERGYPDTAADTDMRENLRYGPAYQSIEPQTELDFSDEGGFSHLVELCNGCGTCRETDSGVMCPTYRASEEEIQRPAAGRTCSGPPSAGNSTTTRSTPTASRRRFSDSASAVRGVRATARPASTSRSSKPK